MIASDSDNATTATTAVTDATTSATTITANARENRTVMISVVQYCVSLIVFLVIGSVLRYYQ